MDLELARHDIEEALADMLPPAEGPAAVLHSAMRWAVDGGGKRVRPLVCLASAEAVGGKTRDAIMPACAIELLHSYTLVHDDLPSMDNDIERRGRPSVWAKFGEATALLAGDALQALAFEALARTPACHPDMWAKLLAVMGSSAVGVVRGQVADLARDGSATGLDYTYAHKTADLFVAAACMGAIAGGGTDGQVAQLKTYAHNFGLAFQYEDDLLDGDSPLDREETERRVHGYTDAALASLSGLPGDVGFLAFIAKRMVTRDF